MKPREKEEDIRFRIKFLWFPKRLNGEWRWLEIAVIRCHGAAEDNKILERIETQVEKLASCVIHGKNGRPDRITVSKESNNSW